MLDNHQHVSFHKILPEFETDLRFPTNSHRNMMDHHSDALGHRESPDLQKDGVCVLVVR
jgi:hypothetical protein